MTRSVSQPSEEARCVEQIAHLSSDILVQVSRLQSCLLDTNPAARNGQAQLNIESRPADCISRSDILLVSHYLKARRYRQALFDSQLFADPGWDLLLDLFVARGEQRPVSVSSACIASGVAATTALRWIKKLEDQNQIERSPDLQDGRRQWLMLTLCGQALINKWLDYMWPRIIH